MNNAKSILAENFIRATDERIVFLEALLGAKKPLTKDEVHQEILKHKEDISRSTMYRTVKYLQEKKIINEVCFGGDELRYEVSHEHHHHVRCNKCEKILAITDEALEKMLEDFQEKIAKKLNLENINHHLEFNGVCATCTK